MPVFNKDSFGEILRVNFYRDISSGSEFKMVIQAQFEGAELFEERPRTVSATLGTVDVVVDDINFLANQYVEFIIQEGDFKDTGRWRTKGIATLPSETIATNYQFFRVMP